MLLAIGASFGVGRALEVSGVAKLFAEQLVLITRPLGPTATMAAIYFGTMVLNELISNNAAAALAFPFCLESARLLGVNERPFIMAVTLAASYAFASPIGYQTHMMVFGPGGYRFTDFVRVGVPLNLLMMTAAVILIPLIWPFSLSEAALPRRLRVRRGPGDLARARPISSGQNRCMLVRNCLRVPNLSRCHSSIDGPACALVRVLLVRPPVDGKAAEVRRRVSYLRWQLPGRVLPWRNIAPGP